MSCRTASDGGASYLQGPWSCCFGAPGKRVAPPFSRLPSHPPWSTRPRSLPNLTDLPPACTPRGGLAANCSNPVAVKPHQTEQLLLHRTLVWHGMLGFCLAMAGCGTDPACSISSPGVLLLVCGAVCPCATCLACFGDCTAQPSTKEHPCRVWLCLDQRPVVVSRGAWASRLTVDGAVCGVVCGAVCGAGAFFGTFLSVLSAAATDICGANSALITSWELGKGAYVVRTRHAASTWWHT